MFSKRFHATNKLSSSITKIEKLKKLKNGNILEICIGFLHVLLDINLIRVHYAITFNISNSELDTDVEQKPQVFKIN